MTTKTLALVTMAALALTASLSFADVIDFNGLANNVAIAQTYGDGANVNAIWNTNGASTATSWTDEAGFPYGDLVDVAYSPGGNAIFEVTLQGLNGQGVRLNSFDLADGGAGGTANVEILRENPLGTPGGTIYSQNGVAVSGDTHTTVNPSHNSFAPVVRIRITEGNNSDVGIDNINFTLGVPEPASLSLLALGGIALIRRRRG